MLEPLADHDPTAADFPHVHPDHSLHLALERLGANKLEVLPVVSRANVRELLGLVVLDDILRAYGVQWARTFQEGQMNRTVRRVSTFSGPSFLRTFVLVISSLIVIFFIDTFLARMEHSESRVEAERFYQDGQRYLKQGQNERAADQFRSAFSVARDNQGYQLALGQALTAANRLSEAEGTLDDLLERDATGGAANLAMARLLARKGRSTRRSLSTTGRFTVNGSRNALGNRVQTRFELIDLLVANHRTDGLLAELLPLEEEARPDAPTKLGNWDNCFSPPDLRLAPSICCAMCFTISRAAPTRLPGWVKPSLPVETTARRSRILRTVLRCGPVDQQAQRRPRPAIRYWRSIQRKGGSRPRSNIARSLKVLDMVVPPAFANASTRRSPARSRKCWTRPESLKRANPSVAARRGLRIEPGFGG